MTTPLVAQHLRNGGTLAGLETAYGISAKRHGRYPNLIQLNYSQIDSPKGVQIVDECRGIILDESDDWRLVSFPYKRFANYSEGWAAPIDWSTARAYEKVDGSLIQLYFYRNEWHVATRGMPDAAGPVFGFGMTFADLFWRTWKDLGYVLPLLKNACFMFELMTPFNRVVVSHPKPRIVLHGFRWLESLHESRPDGAAQPGWEVVRQYPLGSFEEVLASADALNPIEGEGYVVVDADFNRVKVKSPACVALSHAKDGASPRSMLEVIRKGESSELLAHFPEMKEMHEKVFVEFSQLADRLDSEFRQIRLIKTQKDFALAAQKTACSSAMFAMRAGKAKTAREFLSQPSIHFVEKVLGWKSPKIHPEPSPA